MSVNWNWHNMKHDIEPTKLKDASSNSLLVGGTSMNENEDLQDAANECHRQKVSPPPLPLSAHDIDEDTAYPFYLKNEHVKEIINYYGTTLPKSSFTLPLGTFILCDYLREISNNRLLLLVGDKGYPDADEFKGHKDPHLAIHGSISFMVNLHAIKLYFQSIGGFDVSAPYKDTFQVTCLYSYGTTDNFPQSLMYFKDCHQDFVPDSLLSWQRNLQDSIAGNQPVNVKQLLALLRYSAHDAEVFTNFQSQFSSQCVQPFVGPRAEVDLIWDLDMVYHNWYKLRKTDDIADSLAHLCMKTGRLSKALYYFNESVRTCPETLHAATYVNMAACKKALGDMEGASNTIKSALDLSPTFAPAIESLSQINMCNNQRGIAFIGCGAWTVFESLPLFITDRRVVIKALYSFQSDVAENIKINFKLKPDVTTYSGSQGLIALLDRDDIHGCVVDVHSDLSLNILPKIWAMKKHTLTRSPTTFQAVVSKALVDKYVLGQQENEVEENDGTNPIVWHIQSLPRIEGALKQVKEKLREFGRVESFSIRGVNDCGSSGHYTDKENLGLDLLNGLVSTSCLVDGRVDSLCVQYIDAVETARNGTSQNATPVSQNATPVSQNEEGTVSAPRLFGWCKLDLGTHEQRLIGGSFFYSRHGGDNCMRYEFMCAGGRMRLSHNRTSWKVTMYPNSGIPPQDFAFQSMANQTTHDEWLSQIHNKMGTPPSKQMVTKKNTVHKTIHEGVIDASTAQGIFQSMQGGGRPIAFS
eukprot:GHVO01027244.1.p1 GENE.GHVO01027244.1~~GHVO01027244.1.p1  ORF type:complete len:797 (+),score=185.34 GHVO01027244.1:135-2393(+)